MSETKKVLLVLSTSRTSDEVIDSAVEEARKRDATLVALYILEKELANEVFDTFTDIGFIGDRPSADITESLMREYRQRGYEELGKVQVKAMEAGVGFDSVMEEGNYVTTVLDAVAGMDVALAVLVRKKKKKSLLKYFSRSLVEEVREQAPCEVIVFEEN